MSTSRSFIIAFALVFLVPSLACKKKEPEPPKPKTETSSSASTQQSAQSLLTTQRSPNDEMTAQLQKLAGADAKDCGTVPGVGGEVQAASDCAMQSNSASKPFYVRYELPLPGTKMAIATVRATDGKLYTVQYAADGYKQASGGATLTADKKVMTMACADALRVASSGRVTCFAPQQNAGPMPSTPHGGLMTMPPASGMNPHGSIPPAPGANPHGSMPPASGASPHTLKTSQQSQDRNH
jgi:hypothetical protein